MCFLFPCQLTFIFHLSYQLILRFRWIRFVANSFEVHTQPPPPPPNTTPLQRNKTKTLRSYKCKPVILLVSAPWLTNGTTDRVFPLHFNLEYIPRSFYLLASIFCCCELLCDAQFISIMETVAKRVALEVGNDLQLHWCLYLRGKRKAGVSWGSKVYTWRGLLCPCRCTFSRCSSEFCLWTQKRQFPGPGLCVSVIEVPENLVSARALAFEISAIITST